MALAISKMLKNVENRANFIVSKYHIIFEIYCQENIFQGACVFFLYLLCERFLLPCVWFYMRMLFAKLLGGILRA